MRTPSENVRGVHSTLLEGAFLADGHLMALLDLTAVLEIQDGSARS